jgi:glucan 1,3-beta-glucosidase
MAFFERIRDSSNLFFYGGCDWAYFNGYGNECDNKGSGTYCQQNAIRILGSTTNAYLYGTNVHSIENIMLNGNGPVASSPSNYGGWTPGGVIAAYLYDA